MNIFFLYDVNVSMCFLIDTSPYILYMGDLVGSACLLLQLMGTNPEISDEYMYKMGDISKRVANIRTLARQKIYRKPIDM